jgi:ParB family transcriptional regulator, chromosome partitioning protein
MDLGNVREIPYEEISPFVGQPRKYFNEQKMKELTDSIREVGQKVPAIVKLLPVGNTHKYELVDGERRFRVCKSLGIPLKAWVKEIVNVNEQFLESVVANFNKDEHCELEILEAIERIRSMGFTLEKTSAVFGRSVSWLQQYLSLKKLEPRVLEMLSPELPENQRLTYSHALVLATLKPELQFEVAMAVLKQGLRLKEVKYLVEGHTGGHKKRSWWSPREDYKKFQNFLQRSTLDSNLLLKKPENYFSIMFENRVLGDLEELSEMVEVAIGNLTTIKQNLEQVKVSKTGRKQREVLHRVV